ncbi:MAG: hypothetical protein QXY18_04000 [Nitrososphaerota archaeon]
MNLVDKFKFFLKNKKEELKERKESSRKRFRRFLIIINIIIILLIIFLLMNIVYFNYSDGKDLEKAKRIGLIQSIFYSPFRSNFIISVNAIPEIKIVIDDSIHLNKQIGGERLRISIIKGLKNPESFSIFLIHFYTGESLENGTNILSIDLKNPSEYYVLNFKEYNLLKIKIEVSLNSEVTSNFQDSVSLNISPG